MAGMPVTHHDDHDSDDARADSRHGHGASTVTPAQAVTQAGTGSPLAAAWSRRRHGHGTRAGGSLSRAAASVTVRAFHYRNN